MPETIKANVTLARSDIGWISWLSAFSARATGTRDSQTLLDVSPSLQAGTCPEFSEAARRPLLSRQRSEPEREFLWLDQRTRSLGRTLRHHCAESPRVAHRHSNCELG